MQAHSNMIHDLANYLSITNIQNPAISLSDLGLNERNIPRELKIACNTLQTAQFSIDLLWPEHPRAIIHKVHKPAVLKGSTLIPNKPSHLFQLELFYLFDDAKAVFLLHVPAVPKEALLCLIRFYSFLLVY